MAKVKGQMVPPELRDKYNRVLQTNTDNIVSTRQQRSPQSTERQREHQENFIRCTLYWNNLSEEQKADIYNLAQNEGMRYYNYFMNEVLKKRYQVPGSPPRICPEDRIFSCFIFFFNRDYNH